MLGWRELRMEEQVYAFRRQDFIDAWFRFTTTTFYNAPSGCPYFPLPPSATIGFSESIDSIIRQSGSISSESLLSQLHATFFLACEYILDWHKTIRRELASLLPDYKVEDDDEAIHAQLKLATSIFHCNAGPNCRGEGRTLAYPGILFHPCFTLMAPGNGPSSKDPRSIANQKACLMMGGSPWNCSGRVQVHPRQYVVNKILLCCGKDPRSTTAAEMDEQDPRLACVECAIRDRVIISMSWRRAVRVFLYHGLAIHSLVFLYLSRFNTTLHYIQVPPSITHGLWLVRLCACGSTCRNPKFCGRSRVCWVTLQAIILFVFIALPASHRGTPVLDYGI